MEFYRAEFLIDNLKKHTEEENKQRKKEEDDYGKNMPQSYDTSKMMSNAKKGFSNPSFKLPTGGLGSLGKLSL